VPFAFPDPVIVRAVCLEPSSGSYIPETFANTKGCEFFGAADSGIETGPCEYRGLDVAGRILIYLRMLLDWHIM
jgi:hypothetical protein